MRFYFPEQEACARRLAELLGGVTGADAFATISLAGRYRNLPRNQIEVWLPAGAG